MSSSVNPVSPAPASAPGSVVQQAAQGTNAVASNATPNASTTISSMAQLKVLSPQLYKAMVQGIMMLILNQMNDDEQRFDEIEKEAQADEEAG